jgi:hypothetical protein
MRSSFAAELSGAARQLLDRRCHPGRIRGRGRRRRARGPEQDRIGHV